MDLGVWEFWTRLVGSTVSSGYVVAMTLICVLQYVLHVHWLSQARRLSEQQRCEAEGLASALRSVERDQSLRRLENQILREYISANDPQRGLANLLRHFVPHPETGFAALLEWRNEEMLIHQSRGLSQVSCRDLSIGPELRERVATDRAVVLEGSALLESHLWASLASEDREKVCHIALIAVGDEDCSEALFLTTTLCPPTASQDDQLALVQRLMTTVAAGLKLNHSLLTHRVELQSTKEMLELRAVADHQYETPLKMIEAFLAKLIELIEADRGVLFLTSPNDGMPRKPLVRCGTHLQAGVSERWTEHEEKLATVSFAGDEPLRCDECELHRRGIDTLIGSAIIVPLIQEGRLAGIMCLTRRSRHSFSDSQGALARRAAEFLNTTMHRALNLAKVQREARQDGLTELANRRAFDLQIRRAVQVADKSDGQCSLVFFDLDRFKAVNDTYGHQAGDEVLRTAARIVCSEVGRIRATDRALVARYGGEELAVLLPGFGASGALRIAEAVRAAVAETAIPVGSKTLHVTLSAGISTFSDHAQTVEDLISAADGALYQAKASGRNRVCSATSACTTCVT